MKKIYQFFKKRTASADKKRFSFLLLFSLLTNLVSLSSPLLQKQILDRVAGRQIPLEMMLLLLAINLANIAFIVLNILLVNKISLQYKQKIEKELFQNGLRDLSPLVQQKGAGGYMVSMFGDAERIGSLLEVNYFNIIFMIASALVTLLITLQWTPLFLWVVLCGYAITVLIIVLSNRKHKREFMQGREKVYELNPLVLESLENRTVLLQNTNLNKYESTLFTKFNERDALFEKATTTSSVSSALVSAIQAIAFISFFLLAIPKLQANELEISSLVAMLSYFTVIFLPIFAIKELTGNISQFHMLHKKIEASIDKTPPVCFPQSQEIALKAVSVAYDTPILEDISLLLCQKMAIVGLSGEGKTTLFRLLLGAIAPSEGSCMVGELAADNLPKPLLHSLFAIYPQDTFIFNRDLEFNVTLGKKGISETELPHIRAALQQEIEELSPTLLEVFNITDAQNTPTSRSAVLSMINDLSSKNRELLIDILFDRNYYVLEDYERLLKQLQIVHLQNRDFGQRGQHISGGEKNRIATARFLLQRYKRFYLIDEPFTSLDILAEQSLLALLKESLKGMQGILISHKLSIVQALAEHIVVIDQGRISEQGSHEELLQNHSLYSRLNAEYNSAKN